MEIVKLIGSDVLPDSQKVVIETARVIRTGFLQQNAFHKNDTYVPLDKQMWMMEAILHLYDRAVELVDKGVPVSAMAEAGLFDKLVKVKYEFPTTSRKCSASTTRSWTICARSCLQSRPLRRAERKGAFAYGNGIFGPF